MYILYSTAMYCTRAQVEPEELNVAGNSSIELLELRLELRRVLWDRL
jgi:hypothetical protein